ncbi:DUF4747 family protein [Vibrio sp. 1069]|nr:MULTISPECIES: DUF4747 family protein [Vibrio]MBT0066707.1 DUF4747 family protein [Vibrio alginolyticus]MCA2483341.1 DUF4747 family protein [Vibrio alginolyticus]MDW1763178.1 DUF4747 family protein [Vibrio sp. Vb2135]MDW2279646.1 DUF4747 family protein [Vibrio sp. 1402]MDW2332986.1 DUF4747 family protein [Vibrio sp. 1069]
MAHKTLKLGAISIVTHPHSPQNYLKLLKQAEKLDRPFNMRGDTWANISFIRKLEKDQKEPGPVAGEFVKYTEIDRNSEWYSIASKDVATEDELKKIKELPEHLKPNMSRFSFIFYPKSHTLVFEQQYDNKTFSSNYAQKVLSNLLNTPELFDKYGKVHVHIIPETNKVNEILNDKSISYFAMVINRPNPDDVKSAESKFKKRLARLNVEKQETILTPPKGEVIELDEEEKTIAKVAAKNGYVEAKVNNEMNRVETRSTKAHHLSQTVVYNPETTDAFSQLKQQAPKIIQKIQDWINND